MILSKSGYTVLAFIASLLLTSGIASVYASTQVTFGSTQNLSNNSGASTNPLVAAVGSYVYVAWIDTSSGGNKVLFKASGDSGSSWPTSPTVVSTSGKAHDIQMYAQASYVFLTWVTGGKVNFAVSSNNGIHFSSPVTLGSGSGPKVRGSLPFVYVNWAGTNSIYVIASNNYGTSFGTAKIIGTQPGSHENEMVVQGSNVYVSWDGVQGSGEGVYVAVSHDNGATFTTKQLNVGFINRSRETKVAASGTDVYVTWTSDNTKSYEAYVAVSTNSGTTFSGPINLSGNFKSARELQVNAAGTDVYVTFRGQATVANTNQYVSASSDNGAHWSISPINLAPSQTGVELGFGGVTTTGANVYVLWPHADSAGVGQMYFQASQDSGKRWGGGQQLSSSTTGAVGMNDPGDAGPMLATSGGHVFVAWQDSSTGGGDIYFRGS